MCLIYKSLGSCDDLRADIISVIAGAALADEPDPPKSREEFIDRAGNAWRKMSAASSEIANLVHEILVSYHAVKLEPDKPPPPLLFDSVKEMRLHLSSLVHNGFVRTTPLYWLRQ